MKLTNHEWFRVNGWIGLMLIELCLMVMGLVSVAPAQGVSTTTIQGTVYLANGQPGTGTLVVSWPSFTTANGQLVAADSTTVAIAPDGLVSVNLAANQGSSPAGLYYTAIYYMSDGTTNTQYWVVPATAQATLGQVQAQLMPATQAVQAVNKAYVDQAIAELSGSQLTASGGTLSGPLSLCCDPTLPLQAADKHYVDATFAQAVPLTGASMTGPLTSVKLGALYQVDQFSGADFGAKLSACLSGLSTSYGGTCDARNFSGTLTMGSNLTISTANASILLPCATITTANQLIVTAGTRNVSLRGCALRGASTASGSQGGTVFVYSGTGAMVQVGDPTYTADTLGFHLDNVVINTSASTSATAKGIEAYRTQEMNLESLYLLGNSNQTGMTLDGTGNYTGGTYFDIEFSGFQTAINAIGHQVANSATTDWLNASTFVRLHIDCPTSGGSPISGSYGINLQQGDGNTITGGDVEGCSTALHLGANAQNNTIVGLRNENSTNQVVADAGSSYNNWITGGTMFTGQLTDNGTRNSFLDTFHRSFNGINGDWYGSQQDATITNHYRLGVGAGNERGLLNRYQSDYGYRWTMGLSDATAGEQFYQVLDELNNVYRLSVGQYNNGQSSTNNQTVINAAGTGAVVLNGSNNAGTGGVVIGSGGASEATVATISNAGNAQFNGTLQVGGVSTLAGTTTVKNQADAEIDSILWAGLTASQKESFLYKDWNGNSQWYLVKDSSNNWAVNSATGGLDSFKAYQSTNSGDTYINTSNSSGVVRVNYETGSGAQFKVYGGNSSSLYASFTGTTSIQFPGLAASSGHNCLQIDNSGYVTNTGAACGSGGGTGTVNAGSSGQIAYYSGAGTTLSGANTVSVTAGGTGANTASGALTNLGGAALTGASFTGPVSVAGAFSVGNNQSIGPRYDVTNSAFGAKGDGTTDDTAAIQAAFNTCWNNGGSPHGGIIEFPGGHNYVVSSTINAYDGCQIEGTVGNSGGGYSPPELLWNGPVPGTVYNITGVTIAANSTPLYASSSPSPYPQPYMATFTASNSLTAGQWVDIEGLKTSAGMGLNRGVMQVASATSSSFTVVIPFSVTTGTYTDTGTATMANVMIAFDANARYEQAVSNISLANKASMQTNTYQVGFYFGSRVDTGTRIWHGEVSGATEYSYYFSDGGINIDFDKGWRSDAAGIAGIYWRVSGSDSFGMANGTVDNNRSGFGSSSSGAAVMLDNQAFCGNVRVTSRNLKVEVNSSITPGLGAFTLYDCPSAGNGEQFFLSFDSTWVVPASASSAGFNFQSFVMSPANDKAIVLSAINSQFESGTGSNTTNAFVGIPSLSRNNMLGANGWIPQLTYSPSIGSSGTGPGTSSSSSQIIGDLNISQLWQYSTHASDYLYSDTAFAALPNATTLYAGQILAPPAYWSGANGKRYAIDVVYQAGTTGTPNGGATTCTGASGTSVLTCTSATDLSTGQRITIGTDANKTINYVDATNPSSVLVNLTSNLGTTYTGATALTYSAPVIGPEIQMPTKSSSAPTTLAWSQGDIEQNSGAAVYGVAAWVNTAGGMPGTWAGIPLGNGSGQIATSQISTVQGADSNVLTAGVVSGTGVELCTDANGGATTSGCSLGAYLPLTGGVVTGPLTVPSVTQATMVPNALIDYGDSITACNDVTTQANCYHYRMAAFLGAATHTAYDYGGDMACDTAGRLLFPNDSPTIAVPQPLRTLLISTNDLRWDATFATQNALTLLPQFNTCHQALISYMGVPSQSKVMGSAATMTGTCATDTTYSANQGALCTSSGSTLTFSITTAGGPIYIWPRLIYGDTGTWTYSVDGGAAASYSTALTTKTANMTAGNNAAQTVGFIRIPGIIAGTHTIVFTQTTAGNMGIVAVGTPSSAPYADLPPVIVGDTPNLGPGNGASLTSTNYLTVLSGYRAAIASNIALLQGDGLNVNAALVSKYFQGNQPGAPNDIYTDGVHPNDVGHAELYAAFMSSMKFANVPTVSATNAPNLLTTYRQVSSGNSTVLSTDQFLNVGGGGTITLPNSGITSGQQVEIFNYDSTNTETISAACCTYNTFTALKPKSGVIFYYVSTGGGWVPVASYTSPATTGNSMTFRQVTSGGTTVLNTDQYLNVAGGGTVTFPNTGIAAGNWVTVFNYDSSNSETLSFALAPNNTITSLPPKSGAAFYYISTSGGWEGFAQNAAAVSTTAASAPLWLQYLGTGADGAYEATATSCTQASPCYLGGEKYYTSFQVDSGAYVYSNVGNTAGSGLVIHAQGACNIYGTVLANGAKSTWPSTNKGVGGGGSGGSGGGTAAGSAGTAAWTTLAGSGLGGTSAAGTAGAASGGSGGNGSLLTAFYQRAFTNSGAGGLDGLYLTGASGPQGGSSGGVGGNAGGGIVMMCSSINGTGGIIDASGANGMPPSANSTGAGGGGGGGVVLLSSQASVSSWPAVYTASGPGALATVPEALAVSGSCTTQPKATLGVTSGALNGTCTVVQAGAGCGTGTNVTFNIVGGGGSAGTAVVNPTWSSGALASCTVTPGTSSGFTAATYTTSGAGGDGGNGWYAEFQGW